MSKIVGEDTSVVQRVSCKHCAAIIKYTPREVKRYDGRDYSGGADGREWVDCPRCGNEAVIRSW